MGDDWFERLRPLCKEACVATGAAHPVDVVLFYLARWCQKEAGGGEPDLDSLTELELRETVEKIARNLAEDGATVDRLVSGEHADAWTELRRDLRASARSRAGREARESADEALQKIALVLLTGTPPSRAVEQLRAGPEGPANEYIFTSPFSFWALSVVKNLVIDEGRREKRRREGPPPAARKKRRGIDRAVLRQANEALPGLLKAIGELPPAQRSAMTMSLAREDLDDAVRARLKELAPELFSEAADRRFSSDGEIAEHLESTARRVAANRSAARRGLAKRDPLWALLLDALLPHRSTRPVAAAQTAAPDPAGSTSGSHD